MTNVDHKWLAIGLCFVFCIAFTRPTYAGDHALAEALFLEGKRLLEEKKYSQACAKFEASQVQDPSPGTLLNLGRCNALQGKTATAWARYKEAETLAQTALRAEQEREARERIDELEPKLSRLEIKPPSTLVEGLVVKRGGTTMGSESLGIAAPVDPGEYVIEASAPGYETWTGKVTVGASANESITIPELRKLPESAVSTPPAAVPTESHGANKTAEVSPRAEGNATLGYVLTGVGGIALVTGGVFGYLAQKQAKDAEDDPTLCPDKVCSSKGRNEIDSAKTKALISTIGVGVGVAALGAGIYFIVSSPRSEAAKRKSQHRARFTPLADPRNPGLVLSGAF